MDDILGLVRSFKRVYQVNLNLELETLPLHPRVFSNQKNRAMSRLLKLGVWLKNISTYSHLARQMIENKQDVSVESQIVNGRKDDKKTCYIKGVARWMLGSSRGGINAHKEWLRLVELELTNQISPADSKKLVEWRAGLSLGGTNAHKEWLRLVCLPSREQPLLVILYLSSFVAA